MTAAAGILQTVFTPTPVGSPQLAYSITPSNVAMGSIQNLTITLTNPSASAGVTVSSTNRDCITIGNLASLTSGNVSPQAPALPWNFMQFGVNLLIWVAETTTLAPGQSVAFELAGVKILSNPATASLKVTEYISGVQAAASIPVSIGQALTIQAQAIPPIVGLNTPSTLQWTTQGGAYVIISPDASGQHYPIGTSSTAVTPVQSNAQTQYTLTVVQDAAHTASQNVTVTISPPIIDSFTASATTGLLIKQMVTLNWATTYATNVMMQPNPGTPVVNKIGTATIDTSKQLASNALSVTYKLTAHGFGPPAGTILTLLLQYAPMVINYFRFSDFTKTSVILDVFNAQSTNYVASQTPCVLTAIGPGGPLTATLNGSGPEVQVLIANPASVTKGATTTLEYLVHNVATLTLQPGGQTLTFDSTGKGSTAVTPTATTTYTLVATQGATTIKSTLIVPVTG